MRLGEAMRKRRMGKSAQITIGILLVVIAAYLTIFLFFNQATSPFQSARTQVIRIAQQKANLKKAESFGIGTTDHTSYSVIGSDQSDKKIGVIVPKDSEEITVVELDEGISPEKLKEKNTKSIILTLYKNTPAWEVNNSNGFKVYDFETGKKLLG